MVQYFPVVTGSLTVTGSINVSGGITASGGISISGSIDSASFASTASFVALAQSASNAVAAATASFANAFTVAGNLTAQTLVVQTITSSIVYSSGSNVFGNNIANTQVFTGSLLLTGSIGIGTTPGVSSPPLLHLYNRTEATRLRLEYFSGSAGALDFHSGSVPQWSIVVDSAQTYGKIENRVLGGDAIRFYNSTNNVILNPTAGSVGIGITSPTSKLHVVNNTDGFVGRFTGGASSNIIAGIYANSTLSFASIGVQSAHQFRLFTNDADRLTVTSDGNIGIGTTSPDTQLHAKSSSQITAIKSESTHASGYGLFQSKNPNSGLWQAGAWPDNTYRIGLSGVADYFSINADGGIRVIGGSLAIRNSGNSITYGLLLRAGAWLGDATADLGISAETGYNIRFYTDGSATERLRLTTAGQLQSYVSMKVQSGTGGSSAGFIVRPADNTDESTFFGKESYWTLIGANSNEGWKFRGSNGANAFLVNAGSFSYNATLLGSLTQNASDIRLKTNISQIENALEKISTLEGFTYNWKEECPLYNPNSTTKEVGVSAQAVKDILPEVVSLAGFDRDNDDQTKSKSGENYLTVQYEKLVPLLIEGIKELNTKFEEYKATHP